MKKHINIFITIFLVLFISSCITSQDEVNKAKQNLGIVEGHNSENNISNTGSKKTDIIVDTGIVDNNQIKQDSQEEIQKIIKKQEVEKIQIKSLTDNQLLELDDLSKKDLLSGQVEITGKTLGKVDKIIVKYSNESSDFPNDVYQLKQFKADGKIFLYRAFSRYKTLDFGKNIYIFEAYSGDEVTKLELILNVKKDEIKKEEKSYNKIDLSKLPSNETFGTPTDLGNGIITYSDLNGLTIKSETINNFTCDNVTSVLADRINGYFYWNTCRPIKDKEGVSFFVIRLDGNKYVYEKDYYLPYQGLYGVQELETGSGVTNINIGEKNSQLKEKNSDFGILKVSDELFKKILK